MRFQDGVLVVENAIKGVNWVLGVRGEAECVLQRINNQSIINNQGRWSSAVGGAAT